MYKFFKNNLHNVLFFASQWRSRGDHLLLRRPGTCDSCPIYLGMAAVPPHWQRSPVLDLGAADFWFTGA